MSKSKIQNQNPKIVILGGGPAGLYCGLLMKKADPSRVITIIERNPAGVTYGWGVVFSDRTLASFQRADYKTYQQIADNFVIWDAIDVHYRDETIRCGGMLSPPSHVKCCLIFCRGVALSWVLICSSASR